MRRNTKNKSGAPGVARVRGGGTPCFFLTFLCISSYLSKIDLKWIPVCVWIMFFQYCGSSHSDILNGLIDTVRPFPAGSGEEISRRIRISGPGTSKMANWENWRRFFYFFSGKIRFFHFFIGFPKFSYWNGGPFFGATRGAPGGAPPGRVYTNLS